MYVSDPNHACISWYKQITETDILIEFVYTCIQVMEETAGKHTLNTQWLCHTQKLLQ